MVIAINEFSEIPIYQQIRDQIVMGISDGRLQPGEQLPTVRALAIEIGINTMTVSKAYQLLKQEGYIVTERRSGARISLEFANSSALGKQNEITLRRIASEAKLKGFSEEEFLAECRKAFAGEPDNIAEKQTSVKETDVEKFLQETQMKRRTQTC